MRKIKLTLQQSSKLKLAISREQMAVNNFKLAQERANEAANARNDFMDIIYEAHGIDKKDIDQQGKMNLDEDGTLSLPELKTSERIKKEVKKGALKKK